MSGEIRAGAYGTETVARKQRAHGLALVCAVLQREPATGTQVLASARENLLDGFEAGLSRRERHARLEARIAVRQCRVIRGHVRRVRNDEIEVHRAHRLV